MQALLGWGLFRNGFVCSWRGPALTTDIVLALLGHSPVAFCFGHWSLVHWGKEKIVPAVVTCFCSRSISQLTFGFGLSEHWARWAALYHSIACF